MATAASSIPCLPPPFSWMALRAPSTWRSPTSRRNWVISSYNCPIPVAPPNCATHWHYSGTVDFAVFYFPDRTDAVIDRLQLLATKAAKPLQFSDALVRAVGLRLVRELHKGSGCDEHFMTMLAPVMLEQVYRVLTTPETVGFNPRHIHFAHMQTVLVYIREHLEEDLSVPRLAALAGVSIAHFRRLFLDAMGTPPHGYVLATRLEHARKLLATTPLPIAQIAQIADTCGFSSQSHFTACFRAVHASTPAEYRQRVKGEAGI